MRLRAFGYTAVFIIITVLNILALLYIVVFAHEIQADNPLNEGDGKLHPPL